MKMNAGENKVEEKAAALFCDSLFEYKRLETHVVNIGEVPLGGKYPIRIQSMTTTNTMDTEATIAQSLRMVESGCEYVRITAPSIKEAHNLKEIKSGLLKKGCKVPLVADIHFTPNAAEVAAKIVEKVRVNPGNYIDKKKFAVIEYSDAEYQSEIQRIYDRFSPLVKICKAHGTAMRIGTNHGSLSDRILSRYGDTPLGMVESALEFLRICEDFQYDQIVVSMKASNPQVMVQAYRLLVQQMRKNGKIYPLHLGVTEAGEGEDGRIKSALGISTLLMDGIGDTVRVSLTEEPECESPVAKFLVQHAVHNREKLNAALPKIAEIIPEKINLYSFTRRESQKSLNIGSGQVPVVMASLNHHEISYPQLADIGFTYVSETDKYKLAEGCADFAYLGSRLPVVEFPGGLKKVYDYSFWKNLRDAQFSFPLFQSIREYEEANEKSKSLNFLRLTLKDIVPEKFKTDATLVFVAEAGGGNAHFIWRRILFSLMNSGFKQPVIFRSLAPEEIDFYSDAHLPEAYQLSETAKHQLYHSAQLAALLVDGLADGIWIEPSGENSNRTAFSALQLSRLRTTRTEYISCPSCGRTLFDLQETTAMIRKRTEHLKGLKIGIMGCIVNGPGEMADADYGYVGVGPDKIALYRGKTVVEKGVKTESAVDKLIELIRSDGRWLEIPT